MRKNGLRHQSFDFWLINLRWIHEANASDLLPLAFEQTVRIAQRRAVQEEKRDPIWIAGD